ncbi:MAG: hypothetical protein ABI691_06125 [Ginsengibacter sp.]
MNYNQTQSNQPTNDCGCIEPDCLTQVKTINIFRDGYCKDMYVALGEVAQLEVKRTKLKELIGNKNCWFVWTERHYRIYRNLQLNIDNRLIQTNDSIKEGVKNYLAVNKTLAESLKKIAKTVKDIKAKTVELRDMACKLENCMEDTCNCSQMIELTGDIIANCKDSNTPPVKQRPHECDHVKDDLKKLVCMPKNLVYDVDSIFKSSSDVVGIQTFSNVTSIDPLQTELGERIKKIDKSIQDVIKRSEGDLKAVVEDMGKTQKDFAKTEVELYNKRSDFEGIKDAVAFFCCPVCGCIEPNLGDCEKRLDCCERKICDICKDKVKPEPGC